METLFRSIVALMKKIHPGPPEFVSDFEPTLSNSMIKNVYGLTRDEVRTGGGVFAATVYVSDFLSDTEDDRIVTNAMLQFEDSDPTFGTWLYAVQTPAPEPSTIFLFSLGILFFAAHKRNLKHI